jgi:cytochrome c biogenesis protein CcmG, thiol:disulfide interchange protein DsbE
MHGSRFLVAARLCACLVWGCAPSAHALEPGALAPNVTLTDAQRQAVRLPLQKGQVLYVDFWASWCGPCRQSFPWMNAMQAKYQAQGLQIIGINLDQHPGAADKFLAQTPAKFTVMFDPQGVSARLYGVKGMPTSVLIDRDGRVIQLHAGFSEASRAALERQLQSALASKRPGPARPSSRQPA